MKLAPLTDRTFTEYREMGYPLDSPPRRCILIEHRGAIIAAAEITETEGGSFLMLHNMFAVDWVDGDLQTKSVVAISRAARAYSCITGQRCLGVLPQQVLPLMIGDGWSPVVGGVMFNPFLRPADAPVAARRAPAVELRQEPEEDREPEDEAPVVRDDDDDVELVSSLQAAVAERAQREPEVPQERQPAPSPVKRAVRKRQPTSSS